MIKTYQHTFRNGDKVTLHCNLAMNPPRLWVEPFGIVNGHPQEYRQWQHQVVVPDLVKHMSDDQLSAIIATYGEDK